MVNSVIFNCWKFDKRKHSVIFGNKTIKNLDMQLPQSNILTTKYLNRVFDKTVATYKYYWFLGILDLCVKQGKTRMNVWDIMITMVANAWYPVIYFRLSFGKSESLYDAIWALQKEYDIPINISVRDLTDLLHELLHKTDVRKRLNFLQMNVPFRFLRPWIDTSDDRQTIIRSQSFENGCLYKLEKQNGTLWIEINPAWLDYLRENYDILSAFAYWGLAGFLQVRNPNVPAIPTKLVKREDRSSLSAQHKFWNTAINHGMEVRCPDLNLYLPKLAVAHQEALRINLKEGKQNKLLEDYLSLGHTPQDIVSMDKGHLLDCFFQTFTPMHQIALNMGFEIWKY